MTTGHRSTGLDVKFRQCTLQEVTCSGARGRSHPLLRRCNERINPVRIIARWYQGQRNAGNIAAGTGGFAGRRQCFCTGGPPLVEALYCCLRLLLLSVLHLLAQWWSSSSPEISNPSNVAATLKTHCSRLVVLGIGMRGGGGCLGTWDHPSKLTFRLPVLTLRSWTAMSLSAQARRVGCERDRTGLGEVRTVQPAHSLNGRPFSIP